MFSARQARRCPAFELPSGRAGAGRRNRSTPLARHVSVRGWLAPATESTSSRSASRPLACCVRITPRDWDVYVRTSESSSQWTMGRGACERFQFSLPWLRSCDRKSFGRGTATTSAIPEQGRSRGGAADIDAHRAGGSARHVPGARSCGPGSGVSRHPAQAPRCGRKPSRQRHHHSCRRSRWRSRLGVGRRGPLGDLGRRTR